MDDIYRDSEDRFRRDPDFHAAVSVLIDIAERHGFTPADLRQAGALAATQVERLRADATRYNPPNAYSRAVAQVNAAMTAAVIADTEKHIAFLNDELERCASPTVSALENEVTAAIFEAERVGSSQNHATLSLLEERLADALAADPANRMEVKIAQRGAIRAALNSGDQTRVVALVSKWWKPQPAFKEHYADCPWFFLVQDKAGYLPRVGKPCRPFYESVREWHDGNHGKTVFVVRLPGAKIGDVQVDFTSDVLFEEHAYGSADEGADLRALGQSVLDAAAQNGGCPCCGRQDYGAHDDKCAVGTFLKLHPECDEDEGE